MKKSFKMYITGTVQGVFFRDFVKDAAKNLELRGYVRNLDDGRLEIWFEGDGKKCEEMIAVCKAGPKHASIRRVDVQEEAFQDFKEFKVMTI